MTKTIQERIAVLEEKSETQDDINTRLLRAVEELNEVLHQNKGALKLIGWIISLATLITGALTWLKN